MFLRPSQLSQRRIVLLPYFSIICRDQRKTCEGTDLSDVGILQIKADLVRPVRVMEASLHSLMSLRFDSVRLADEAPDPLGTIKALTGTPSKHERHGAGDV